MKLSETSGAMDIHAVLQYLPHRYPFLLVDRVLECQPGSRILAVKNVSINEPFFPGHFPHHPVMPGVLIIEAMAQAAAILSFKTWTGGPTTSRCTTSPASTVRASSAGERRRPAAAGSQHRECKRGLWKYTGVARVDGQVAAEAELLCTLRDLQ